MMLKELSPFQENIGVGNVGDGAAVAAGQGATAQIVRGNIFNVEDGATVIIDETRVAPAADEMPAPGEPPFKGLQYFDTGDAGLFCGREALTAKLIGRLREQRFLAVVGASGSGKSSLVRAG